MENRFFIRNVFLSFWRFSKLCSELRGPLRAEDGKFVFSGSKMFEMFRGGATHPEAQGRWRHVGVKDRKWREPRTALLEISVQLKATSERSRNEAERGNLLIRGTISCYLQSSESVVKISKIRPSVFIVVFPHAGFIRAPAGLRLLPTKLICCCLETNKKKTHTFYKLTSQHNSDIWVFKPLWHIYSFSKILNIVC